MTIHERGHPLDLRVGSVYLLGLLGVKEVPIRRAVSLASCVFALACYFCQADLLGDTKMTAGRPDFDGTKRGIICARAR